MAIVFQHFSRCGPTLLDYDERSLNNDLVVNSKYIVIKILSLPLLNELCYKAVASLYCNTKS